MSYIPLFLFKLSKSKFDISRHFTGSKIDLICSFKARTVDPRDFELCSTLAIVKLFAYWEKNKATQIQFYADDFV